MHTRRFGRLTGATAQRLLDGGDGPAPLPQLLSAATAPATAAELRGEAAARAAFRSSTHAAPLSPDIPRRAPGRVTSSVIIAKVIAAITLTASTAGGIALATTSAPAEAGNRAACGVDDRLEVHAQDAGPRAGPDRGILRHVTGKATSLEVRPDLADEFLGDLGQAVFFAGVAGNLLEDALLGLGGERRGASGHYGAAGEGLHRISLPTGVHVLPRSTGPEMQPEAALRSVARPSLYRPPLCHLVDPPDSVAYGE